MLIGLAFLNSNLVSSNLANFITETFKSLKEKHFPSPNINLNNNYPVNWFKGKISHG